MSCGVFFLVLLSKKTTKPFYCATYAFSKSREFTIRILTRHGWNMYHKHAHRTPEGRWRGRINLRFCSRFATTCQQLYTMFCILHTVTRFCPMCVPMWFFLCCRNVLPHTNALQRCSLLNFSYLLQYLLNKALLYETIPHPETSTLLHDSTIRTICSSSI